MSDSLPPRSPALLPVYRSLEAFIAEHEANKLALHNAMDRLAVLESAKECPECGKMRQQRDAVADVLAKAEKLMAEVAERPNVPNREMVRDAAVNARTILETIGR